MVKRVKARYWSPGCLRAAKVIIGYNSDFSIDFGLASVKTLSKHTLCVKLGYDSPNKPVLWQFQV